MKGTTNKKRGSFWIGLFKFAFYSILLVAVVLASWDFAVDKAKEPRKTELLAFEAKVEVFFEDIKSEVVSLFDTSSKEQLEIEGAKLSDIAPYKLNCYTTFTIPYTWTVGEIEVDDTATEEAIAVTGDDVLMIISLKNIEMENNVETLKWSRENLLFELKNIHPNYHFTRSDLFEENAAIIECVDSESDVKMYMAIIPVKEKTLFVSYSYKEGDWMADVYFNAAISEMIENA